MLLHITSSADWAAARDGDRYEAPSLLDEGFIHCSTPDQVVSTANRYYAGRDDLVLLSIDPALLTAEVRFENTVGGAERFPHVYGPIDRAAVIDARPWAPRDGCFEAPGWVHRGSIPTRETPPPSR